MDRFHGIDRLFLTFAVLMSNAGVCDIEIMPGHVAVQIFFIISGFNMWFILSTKIVKSETVLSKRAA